MKIYQLHKYGGEWEDYRDRIIGSYLHKDRAEEEMAKAEAKENELREQSDKCSDCPYLHDAYLTNDELLSYCSKAKLEKNEYDNDMDCQNYTTHWDDNYFKIKEVEVIE